MQRGVLGIALGIGLSLVACTRGEDASSGAPALSVGPPTAAVERRAAAEPSAAKPIAPILPEPPRGDQKVACRTLVGAGRYDVALRPCLLALQADPRDEQLIAAVKQIQASVANAKPAGGGEGGNGSAAPASATASTQGKAAPP